MQTHSILSSLVLTILFCLLLLISGWAKIASKTQKCEQEMEDCEHETWNHEQDTRLITLDTRLWALRTRLWAWNMKLWAKHKVNNARHKVVSMRKNCEIEIQNCEQLLWLLLIILHLMLKILCFMLTILFCWLAKWDGIRLWAQDCEQNTRLWAWANIFTGKLYGMVWYHTIASQARQSDFVHWTKVWYGTTGTIPYSVCNVIAEDMYVGKCAMDGHLRMYVGWQVICHGDVTDDTGITDDVASVENRPFQASTILRLVLFENQRSWVIWTFCTLFDSSIKSIDVANRDHWIIATQTDLVLWYNVN